MTSPPDPPPAAPRNAPPGPRPRREPSPAPTGGRISLELLGILETAWLLVLPPWKRRRPRYAASLAPLPQISAVIGLVLAVGGALAYILLGLSFTEQYTGRALDEMMRGYNSGTFTQESVKPAGFGLVGWLTFALTPLGFFLLGAIAEGTVRAVAGFGAGQATAFLPAYPVALLWDRLDARRWREGRLRELGPEVPDRLEYRPLPDGRIEVVVEASREKPWHEVEAIRIGADLFELAKVEEKRAPRLRLIYRLHPWPASRIVRRIVDYRPPASPK